MAVTTAANSPTATGNAPVGHTYRGRLWDPTSGVDQVYAEIDRLGLGAYVLELDQKGYTIVPPEKVGPAGYAEELLEAAMRLAERETGIVPDLATGATHSSIPEERRKAGSSLFPFQEEFSDLIFKDRAFEQFLLNPTVLALVTYLLGEHAQLSDHGLWFRGPTEAPADFIPASLHSDHYGIPAPFPPYAQVCNATLALTDYTREGGCLGFIPGSHHLQRHPLVTDEAMDRWTPAECPAGSLIFWHGNTWHTIGNPRTIPGLRVSYTEVFCRAHIMPITFYRDWTPQEMVARNPARFATLMGFHHRYPRNTDPLTERSQQVKPAPVNGLSPAPSPWE